MTAALRSFAPLVLGLVFAGCGEQDELPYAVRYDLFYGADLTQDVSMRWGTAVATGSPAAGASTIAIEHRFATRDQVVGSQRPVDVMLGGTAIFSETPSFAACDFVGDAGLDPAAVRIARFSRAIESHTGTVLKLSRSSRPALSCYTTPTIVDESWPLTQSGVAVFFLLNLPMAPYGFTLDGQTLLPVAVGHEEQDTRVWFLIRAVAPVGSQDLGQLALSSAAATGVPFTVTTADCPVVNNWGRPFQKVQTLAWEGGVLSVDAGAGIFCCYDSGGCARSIP